MNTCVNATTALVRNTHCSISRANTWDECLHLHLDNCSDIHLVETTRSTSHRNNPLSVHESICIIMNEFRSDAAFPYSKYDVVLAI